MKVSVLAEIGTPIKVKELQKALGTLPSDAEVAFVTGFDDVVRVRWTEDR